MKPFGFKSVGLERYLHVDLFSLFLWRLISVFERLNLEVIIRIIEMKLLNRLAISLAYSFSFL